MNHTLNIQTSVFKFLIFFILAACEPKSSLLNDENRVVKRECAKEEASSQRVILSSATASAREVTRDEYRNFVLGGESSHALLYSSELDNTPPTVTPSYGTGSYAPNLKVTFGTSEDARIFYTLDNSEPNVGSAKYDPNQPIVINSTTILKYFALDISGLASEIQSVTYTIDGDAPKVEFIHQPYALSPNLNNVIDFYQLARGSTGRLFRVFLG